MRDIQFRGKRKDTGSWVYGNLIMIRGRAHINAVNRTGIVNTNTVGQYTGLHDKNGNRIFEGDVLFGFFGYGEKTEAVVEYEDASARFVLVSVSEEDRGKLLDISDDRAVIVGNIYDNPEFEV